MDYPLTVLMATYNDGRFLPMAMESILSQTYRHFRFLIVDDASTDETPQIIRSYNDPRIEHLRLEKNAGQTVALNIGLRHTSTPWIARMDADDVSAPQRLEDQMRTLREEESLRCVGTAIWEFREDPRVVEIIKTRPQHYAEIKRAALRGSGIIHGSMVINRQALLDIGAYDERYRYASDRDMVIRFLSRYRATNIPEPLLGVRRHRGQDSFSLKAAEEYIDIFTRSLHANGHSSEEAAILRRSLAFAYLFRSGCFKERGWYELWWEDQVRAFILSPNASLRNTLGALSDAILPRRFRILLRKDTVDTAV